MTMRTGRRQREAVRLGSLRGWAELLQNERKRMEKERFGGKAILWECRVRCI